MIETARLILDRHGSEDLERIRALWCDPLVLNAISGAPCSQAEARARLLRYAGQWALDGWGFFAVRARADGAYLGEVGFLNAYRDIAPRADDMAEMGWVMGPGGRGNGMALEAVEAALAWADVHIARSTVHCMIAPDNAPSLMLAARVGFKPAHMAQTARGPVQILERPRGG